MKPKPPLYDPSHPEKNNFDKLGRDPELINLTNIIEALDPPFVLAIDSDWGTGKTTFIQIWQERLKEKGFPTLFFNAWENDFTEDPMIAFVAELDGGIKKLLNTEIASASAKGKIENALKNTTELGEELSKKLGPTLIRILTKFATHWTIGEEAGKEIGDLISSTAEKIAHDWVEEYEKNKNLIKEFRTKLEELINHLKEIQKDEPNKSLIFFIDELDRCRPTYAIQLLERIKHFFSVKGIIFILAVVRKQLEYSIKGVYGSEMDVGGYLRRFIDLDYRLNKPSADKYVSYLFQELELKEAWARAHRTDQSSQLMDLKDKLTQLVDLFDLSLREQEQLCSRLNIIFRTISQSGDFDDIVLPSLLVLSIKDSNLYAQVRKGILPLNTVFNKIYEKLTERNTGVEVPWVDTLEAYTIWATEPRHKINDRIKKIADQSDPEAYSREDNVRQLLSMQFSQNGAKIFSQAFKKIELLEGFEWT